MKIKSSPAEEADLVIIPVPWDVTVAGKGGTADAPAAIEPQFSTLSESVSGLYMPWKLRSTILPVPDSIYKQSEKFRDLAQAHSNANRSGQEDELRMIPKSINEVYEKLHIWVGSKALTYLRQGKLVAILGGEQGAALGLIRTLAKRYKSFGILQIDAHADLRMAADGFAYANSSCMYNALQLKSVSRLVLTGLREVSSEEASAISSDRERIKPFFHHNMRNEQFRGISWHEQCERMIGLLPDHVYVSFDIDALDPSLCPNTASPVPGGMSYEEVTYLVELMVREGKKIIGFDLSEAGTAENDWDVRVAAKLLYFLSSWMAASHGLILSAKN